MAGERKEAVRAMRWRLWEVLFMLSYRACPDKDALDFVMKYGAETVRAIRAARPLGDGE